VAPSPEAINVAPSPEAINVAPSPEAINVAPSPASNARIARLVVSRSCDAHRLRAGTPFAYVPPWTSTEITHTSR